MNTFLQGLEGVQYNINDMNITGRTPRAHLENWEQVSNQLGTRVEIECKKMCSHNLGIRPSQNNTFSSKIKCLPGEILHDRYHDQI